MLDAYRQRLTSQGEFIGEVIKNQSDMIMEQSFDKDVATKKCYINGVLVLAKFQKYTTYSLNKDIIDYHLQFKPQVHYPIGTYVSIPDDTGTYNTWLIVGKDDDSQFVKYNIIRCNWTLKWIYKGIIYSCLGILRDSANNQSDIKSDAITTDAINGQLSFWLPINLDTQTIPYDMRFMLTKNKVNPLVYKVVGIQESLINNITAKLEGIVKLTLRQDSYNSDKDNIDLMIADYYQSSITPTAIANEPITSGYSKITYNGISPTLTIGGSSKVLTATFYDSTHVILNNVIPIWDVIYPPGYNDKFSVKISNNVLQINASLDYNLIGKIVTIQIHDNLGNYESSIELEVKA